MQSMYFTPQAEWDVKIRKLRLLYVYLNVFYVIVY